MKTLYYGGTILTMEQPLYREAMLTEDEKILELGDYNTLRNAAPECRLVDLKGKILMPAFIDPHSHFFQVATSLLRVPLGGVNTICGMRDAVSAFITERKIGPGEWVNARDYDNNCMPDLKNPTLEQLDSFAPDNPLVIHFKSGHMGLMNSLALRKLGITAQSQSPEGGLIQKEDGNLTGYLEENAFFEALKKIPMPDVHQLLEACRLAQEKYASYGITTVQDGMVVSQMLPMYRLLLRQKILNLDVVLYAAPEDYHAAVDICNGEPTNTHLSCGGMKIFLDGSPQGRTAWMRHPYAGESSYRGYGTMTDEAVTESFCTAARANTQLIAHCNGDEAAAQFIRCLDIAEQKYPSLRDLRPVIIHGQLMGTDQLPDVKRLGAAISFFAAHVYHWGDVHIRNFGMDRAEKISPAAAAMQSGINVTFHQDAPVIEPDMLETVWCAVNRFTKDGVKLDGGQTISALEALRAVTINGAWQYGQEKEKGSLAPGKRADFVILSQDPLKVPEMEIRNIQILATVKDGEILYEA